MTFISYAQNFEDVMLWRALKHVQQGFWIDVGTDHPDQLSVTRAFSDRGWHGINIEANPPSIARIVAARPRDITLAVAAGADTGSATFFEVVDTGMSTLDRGIAEQHRLTGYEIREHQVQLRTLASICAEHAPADIHFLKIDVEGAERDVLAGADFTSYRPWIVLVEATKPASQEQSHAPWEPLLLAANYRFAWFDGLNRFYIAEEFWDELATAFATPPNVFDDFVRVTDAEHFDRIIAAEKHAQLAKAQAERALDAEQAKSKRLARDTAALSKQLALHREEAVIESERLTARVAAISQELAQAREQEEVKGKHLAAEMAALSEQLAQERGSLALAASRASRYDRLVLELRDEGGPGALRTVLPLARLVRRVDRVAGRDKPVPASQADRNAPVSPTGSSPPHGPGQGRLRSMVKKGVFGVYKVSLRPIVRPAMWRLRTFMLQPIFERLERPVHVGAPRQHSADIDALRHEQTQLLKSLEMLTLTLASNPRREG